MTEASYLMLLKPMQPYSCINVDIRNAMVTNVIFFAIITIAFKLYFA
jgi:hypothetical protein